MNYYTSEDYDSPVISFEGPEKRILAYFQSAKPDASLRSIDSSTWAQLLSLVGCEILSEMRNDHCTSFVLSESSLFVCDKHLMIKTCGRTRLLNFLEPLQEQIKLRDLELDLERVIYSRKNYYFPEAQFAPHRSWDEEHSTLDKMLPGGKSHVMGSQQDEDQWYTYIWESQQISADFKPHQGEKTPVFEVMMMNLSRSKMEQFYQKQDETPQDCSGAQLADGKVKYSVTEESGIVNLVPGSMIDDFQFDPCGYSMNGLKGECYWTIHITPEAQCSYVSFETNVQLSSKDEYMRMLQQLVKTFEPGRFTVTLYGRDIRMSDIVDLPLTQFNSLSSENYRFSAQRNVAMCNYISHNDAYEQRELALVKKYVAEKRDQQEQMPPFYLVNTSMIESQMQHWKEMLPRVRPLYTVSCNSSPQIIDLVHRLGAGFDCANAKDIGYLSQVKNADITFSNPYFKQVKDLMFASANGVQQIIVDNDLSELDKIARHAPQSKLLLRINTSGHIHQQHGDSSALGSRPEQCAQILKKAHDLGLQVVGVALVHQFENFVPSAQRLALWTQEALPTISEQIFPLFPQYGYEPKVLDIGGSIWSMGVGLDDDRPGYDAHFDSLAGSIQQGLDLVFPHEKHPELQIVATDSASFLVSKSHTLVCQVFGKRMLQQDTPSDPANPDTQNVEMEYYINDGYFGSVSQSKVMSVGDRHHHKTSLPACETEEVNDLSSLLTPHLDVRAVKSITATTEFHKSSIFGPSCDKSLDCLCKSISLPVLEVGDVCYFMNMGAVQHHYDKTRSSADFVFIDGSE
eukprot:CAMPEP_0117434820 /NCGR_PEP_ID=MMETSP0759-20121206/149_1 /TAXON_ID=63605 /ORGANISM="Percolomonas cosmopolitus, Strain WS" /LENGTH=797 /DNA_ID=CAMNT_0005226321 /DNA_START=142 /DNA_END=2535 /DNA_ORIENTATION=+